MKALCGLVLLASFSAVAASDGGVYLDRSVTGIDECLDPASPFLRANLAQPVRDVLPATEVAADVELLGRLLQENYAGYPALAQRPGFDAQAFFRATAAELRAHGGNVSAHATFDRIYVTLRRYVLDMHLGSGVFRRAHPELIFHEYQAQVPPGFDATACALPKDETFAAWTLRVTPQLSSEGVLGSVLTVSRQGTADSLSLHCGDADLTLHRRAPRAPRAAGEAIYSTRAVGKALVIRVRDLYGSDEELAQLGKIAADYAQHRRAPVLVWDFRGNGGGNDGFIYSWIEKAKRGFWESGVDVVQHGPLLRCYQWNALVLQQLHYGTVETPAATAARAKLSTGWPFPFQPSYQDANDGIGEYKAKQPYAGRIFVLLDSGAGSSGESAPLALKHALGATLVGERSGGFLEYGNEALVMLPRTGVSWQFGTKRNFLEERVEGVGVPVDVYLEEASMPAEKLVPLLEKLPVPPRK